MVSADAVIPFCFSITACGYGWAHGCFSGRLPRTKDGRPAFQTRDPVMELEITGALCGAAAGAADTLRHITDGLAQHRALGGVLPQTLRTEAADGGTTDKAGLDR